MFKQLIATHFLSQKIFIIGKVVVALLIALVCSTPTYALSQAEPTQSATPDLVLEAPTEVRVLDLVSDERIENRIREIMETAGWFTNLQVQSKNGFVILDGDADAAEHSRWAEAIASRTVDVVGVDNRLTVASIVDLESTWSLLKTTLYRLWLDTLQALPLIIVGLLVLSVAALVAKLSRRLVQALFKNRAKVRANFADLLVQLTSLLIWVLGITVAVVIAFPGVTPSKALTLLGLGSVAIGFAFKDIFENFFAGVLILWRYPFDRGDVIQVGEVMGRVQTITVRNTLIHRPDGELVVVPNATMFKSNVEILTYLKKRRVRLTCGIAYAEDIEEAVKVIRSAVNSCQTVDFESPVEVVAHAFGESSVDLEILWWAGAEPKQVRASRGEVITAIKKALDQARIEIPFPYRNLFIHHSKLIAASDSPNAPATKP